MAEITLTYKLLLQPDARQSVLLSRTCDAYLQACDLVSRTAREHRTLKQKELNKLTYRETRSKYGLGAQMAQSAIIRVIGNYRTIKENHGSPWKTKEAPRYTSAGYDLVWNRDYSILSDGRFSVNTLDGRIKLRVDWSHVPEDRRRGRYGTARLLSRNGKWLLNVPVTFTIPDAQIPRNIMGVDLGMRFLAVSYDSYGVTSFFNGKEVTQKRAQYKALRTQLQKRQTRSARRRLHSIGRRENRWMSDLNHQVAKALVNQCKQPTLLVLEDLKGIRNTTEQVKRSRRYVQVSWAFYQLRQLIEYKAKLNGHTVVYIDPAYTSQACPICGQVRKANRRKTRHEYVCANCGYRSNDDRIAAMNIRQCGYMTVLDSITGTPIMEGRSQSSPDVPPASPVIREGNKGRRQLSDRRMPTMVTAGQGQASTVRSR
ncbi:RNA-guided endonuclease TnpB family protein [Bifidobacterium sp. SO1]|uniref:RNA-guided endonuclease InsQ/TnpB family protein n=1 Tax=Bifidobacterium sp. SO1 TaxID=2809029 RepID=UPI001BDCB0B6|nr:RNA-guided endonuclease TnpB family protein [Bifidobacterium sp. SO1]MBT1162560.1 transposase [Bifidobacterium sp. SO1]